VHPHHLVALPPIAGDGLKALGDEVLNQLGARGLVLDRHDIGPEPGKLDTDRALQIGVFEECSGGYSPIVAPDLGCPLALNAALTLF
jgi:hypothetical protein